MSTWAPLPRDDELERADELLDQADALLRRHRGAEPGAARPRAALDDDDLPILTDVVDESELEVAAAPATGSAPSLAPTPAAPRAGDTGPAPPPLLSGGAQTDAERAIVRELESWIAREMPRILASELDRIGERLQAEMLAHLRATLPPGGDRPAESSQSDEGPAPSPNPR